MLTLDQCLSANRPLVFVVCESDVELLMYLNDNYNKGNYKVYSTTIAGFTPLDGLIKKKFCPPKVKALTTIDALSSVLSRTFEDTNNFFETFVFLDCFSYVNDTQNIRRIKDILSRYQMDTEFTVNMIFVSQTVCVPPDLERLSEVVFFDLPDGTKLRETSDRVSDSLELKGDSRPSGETVNSLRGMTLFEVEQSYLQSWQLYKKIDLNFIREFKKTAIAKTNLLSLFDTDVTFEDIGGMSTLKQWVEKSAGGWTVEGKEFGLPLLKGLLMVGLPGCGKSLLAKAIGSKWGLPLIAFDPSRVFSSRVGVSEQNMRRVLQIIENVSPCVLMVDEIEKAFAGSQSSTFSDSGVTSRVIMQFLIWMQECQAPVFTIATSNNIQYMPPEMISRFDETFFVNLPQHNEREEIFKIHLIKLNRYPDKFDLSRLANESKDLSGREIEQALRESMYDAFYEKTDISTELISRVLNKKTNLLTTMAEQLKYLLKWVGWDDIKKDGIRARYAHPVESEDMDRVRDQIEKLISDVEGDKDGQV